MDRNSLSASTNILQNRNTLGECHTFRIVACEICMIDLADLFFPVLDRSSRPISSRGFAGGVSFWRLEWPLQSGADQYQGLRAWDTAMRVVWTKENN